MIAPVYALIAAAALLSGPPSAPLRPAVAPAAEAPVATREVQVRVLLETPDGEPVPPLPFHLYISGHGSEATTIATGRTDEHGTVTLRGLAPVDAKRVFVSPYLLRDNVDADTARESAKATRDLDALRMKYYVPDLAYMGSRPYVDAEVAARGLADVRMKARRAIVVSGVVQTHDGASPVSKASVFARASSSPVRTDTNGLFRLFGLPKDEANELFVTGFPQVVPVPMAVGTTGADVSIPPVRMPDLTDAVDFRVQVVGWGALRTRLLAEDGGRLLSDGMTLVRSDGSLILTWLDDATQKYDVPRRAPAGKYYLAPGRFSAHPLQLRLLDAVRAGVDLSKTEVPSIELPQPGADVLVLDSVQAAAAIEKVTLPVGDAGGGRAPQGP